MNVITCILYVLSRYLASGCSIGELHYAYMIGKSTVAAIIRHVCEVIWRKLKDIVMREPSEDKWIAIAQGSERNAKFPN
jgi:hypothetical protein